MLPMFNLLFTLFNIFDANMRGDEIKFAMFYLNNNCESSLIKEKG